MPGKNPDLVKVVFTDPETGDGRELMLHGDGLDSADYGIVHIVGSSAEHLTEEQAYKRGKDYLARFAKPERPAEPVPTEPAKG